MNPVNIHEAKTQLSKLIEIVEAGNEVIIARAGKPVAKLVPMHSPAKPLRKPGALKGRIRISPEFDDPLPQDILDAFEGKADEDPA